MELGKIPPHDIEAEQAVLGSMLTDKEAIVSAIEVLRPEDFYRDDNKTIFKAISNIYAKGGAVDIITVKDELTTMAKLEAIGGLQYLAELPEKVPTTANVEKYIKIVEEKSLLRSLIKDANNLLDLGYSQTEDSTNIIESAQSKMFDMLQRKSQKGYEEISKIYELKYSYGKVELKEFLEAKNSELEAKIGLLKAKYTLLQDELNIYKAMAGKFNR